MAGDVVKAPPSILYCTLNPDTAVTAGKVNAEAHVLAGTVRTGAVGNITILTELLIPHEPVPVVPAEVLPHVADKIYRACTV